MAVAQVAGVEQGDEDLDDARVELRPGDAAQLLDRLQRSRRRAVGVPCRDHVVDVGDGEDAGEDRDPLAAQAPEVPGPVQALVVREDDRGDRPVAVHAGDDLRPLVGMASDDPPVLLRQRRVGLEDVGVLAATLSLRAAFAAAAAGGSALASIAFAISSRPRKVEDRHEGRSSQWS